MAKTEVYSWRLEPALKSELESAARRRDESLSALLARIARDWLKGGSEIGGATDQEQQRRLQRAASRYVGTVSGGDPGRAEEAGQRVREVLRRRHGRTA